MMTFNSRLFTREEKNNGMYYEWFFDYEHNKVIVRKDFISSEVKHVYTYKKGCDIYNRYQDIIHSKEWKRYKEEIDEDVEYRYGKKY